jgi:hypothetical protein
VNSRVSRSGTGGATGSGIVVRLRRSQCAPTTHDRLKCSANHVSAPATGHTGPGGPRSFPCRLRNARCGAGSLRAHVAELKGRRRDWEQGEVLFPLYGSAHRGSSTADSVHRADSVMYESIAVTRRRRLRRGMSGPRQI